MAAPRPAKDIKPTADLRTQFLNDVKEENRKKLLEELKRKAKAADGKTRPAKDLKPGDLRSKALEEAKKLRVGKTPSQKVASEGWRAMDPSGELSKRYEPPVKDAEGRLRPSNYKDGMRPSSGSSSTPAKDLKPGDLRSKALQEAKDIAKKRSSSSTLSSAAKGAAARLGGAAAFYFGDTFGDSTLNKGEKEWIADKKNRGPLMKGLSGKVGGKTFERGKGTVSLPVKDRGKTFNKGKGTAALPKSEQETKFGLTGGSGSQGYGMGSEGQYLFGNTPKDRNYYSGNSDEKAPIPKAKPARDKSRLADKKADKVVQGAEKKVSDFALATRRGRSDEYLKAKMRPKKSLMDLFKSEKKATPKKVGKPLTSTFAKKNLAANQKLGKSK
jgi:hypothetical protein